MKTVAHPPSSSRRAAAAVLLAVLVALLPPAQTFGQGGAAYEQRPPTQRTQTQRPQPKRPARPRADEGARAADARAAAATWQRPRLVLLIAVDQFRYEYLERFGDLFAPNGLNRLLREGASWTNANYDHVPTETAPGHATMMTGTWPAETGIMGNEWYERSDEGDKGRRVNNVWVYADDEEEAKKEAEGKDTKKVTLLGGGKGDRAASPRRLLASTVGDELRLASNGRAKVIGISLKDRSAILPAGRHASAAYWYSVDTGQMISSTYYFDKLPEWVARFNAAKPADEYFNKDWTRLVGESEYLRRAGPDDPEWEWKPAKADRESSLFPHRITGGGARPDDKFYNALQSSPFASDLLVRFAKEAITNEALGADAETDVLTVSFSSNDFVGHRFGPYSHEVMDITLRTDRQIGELLDFIDRRVGLRNTLVAFTADHGVAPIPEHAESLGLPGRRVDPKQITDKIKNALRQRFRRASEERDHTADYFLEYTAKNGNLFFNLEALRRDNVPREEAERVACDGALKARGVVRCFTRAQLARGSISPADAVARRVLHGFNPKRSGDVVVVTEAFHLVVTYTADHFSPYSYDTHVPVIIMGAGVAPGRYAQPAAPSDIAPTLAALLRAQPPSNATGRVLIEAMKKE